MPSIDTSTSNPAGKSPVTEVSQTADPATPPDTDTSSANPTDKSPAADSHQTVAQPTLSVNDIFQAVAKKLSADLYLYSGELRRDGAIRFIDTVEQVNARKEKALLILCTYGGDADAAYLIARHLRRMYKEFTLCVFGPCKSAGTLLALGAQDIIMSCRGEFGPLDVQISKEDDIGYRSSGLAISKALESLNEEAYALFERQFLGLKRGSGGMITTRTAGEIASSLAVGLLSPITGQIDPVKMGEVQRAMDIAHDYGLRLNTNQELVRKLTQDYPTHSFVIDLEEATELFGNVREPDQWENALEQVLLIQLAQETGYDCIRNPYPTYYIAYLNPKENSDDAQAETKTENKEQPTLETTHADSHNGKGASSGKAI